MMNRKKMLLFISVVLVISSCSVFRKKCNCPKVSQEKKQIEKVYG